MRLFKKKKEQEEIPLVRIDTVEIPGNMVRVFFGENEKKYFSYMFNTVKDTPILFEDHNQWRYLFVRDIVYIQMN